MLPILGAFPKTSFKQHKTKHQTRKARRTKNTTKHSRLSSISECTSICNWCKLSTRKGCETSALRIGISAAIDTANTYCKYAKAFIEIHVILYAMLKSYCKCHSWWSKLSTMQWCRNTCMLPMVTQVIHHAVVQITLNHPLGCLLNSSLVSHWRTL